MKPNQAVRHPLVCVVVDSTTGFGRNVLRGLLKYVNLERRWILHEDLWNATNSDAQFPECDGAVVAGVTAPVFEKIRAKAKNLILCSSSKQRRNCPSVGLDDRLAGQAAAKHLLECNLKNFAFYPLVSGGLFSENRYLAFRSTVMEKGYPCQLSTVSWPKNNEWLSHKHYKKLADWITSLPKPVGIMAAADVVAHDLARCCQQIGVSVPDEVAIIGVNNDELLCEGAWPPLSSVDVDYSRVGFRAAELLNKLLNRETLSESEQTVRLPPLGVVPRTSTNVLNVSDTLLADAIRYIRAHACDPCNVQDVLRHVPIARRKLERKFVEEFGRTPHQEIQRARLEYAVRLLTNSDLPLAQVAPKCGFATVQNFTKAFRGRFNQTPAAYRRTVRTQ